METPSLPPPGEVANLPAWLVAGEHGDALLAAAGGLAHLWSWLAAGDHGDTLLAVAGRLAHLRRHKSGNFGGFGRSNRRFF
jgi:hypothetical protein